MPKYWDDRPELEDKRPCAAVREDFKNCLLASDCVRKDGKTPRECLKAGLMDDECNALRVAFFECKRSLLDNRTRFRGRKGY
ncbi:cytochrome c oxidase assembly factor 5-like [Ptychodera flava]|uniref:cytochrome c oxidase assembly factor 5-like n=1 Tax=Ptychodera flava TaxID=63121 RepID=UPI00396A8613